MTPELYDWEDISESFCQLRIAQISGRKILVLVDKYSSQEEFDYIRRYLATFPGLEIAYGFILFNVEGKIAAIDDAARLQSFVESENPLILAWHSRARLVVKDAPASFFGQLAPTPLTLPNYRFRCEELYLKYYGGQKQINSLENLLHDASSVSVMKEILRAAWANDIYRLPEGGASAKYFDCYTHIENEVWINCGACRGDTIMNFLANRYAFRRIFAIEGDRQYFADLRQNLALLPDAIGRRIRFLDFYLNSTTSPDLIQKLFTTIQISLINMDIEGYELEALATLEPVILKNRPVLAIAAYHRAEDLVAIPAFVNNLATGYNFFLRKYCGAEPNAFNEYIYYCVPDERLL